MMLVGVKPNKKRLVVTNSEMGEFRSCRQRWWFKYEQLLRRKRAARPLTVGTTVHAGISAMYLAIAKGQSEGVTLSADELTRVAHEAQKQKLQESLALMVDLFSDSTPMHVIDEVNEESRVMEIESQSAVERFVAEFGVEDQKRYIVLAVEQPFLVPLLDENGTRRSHLDHSGVWDLVLFDRVAVDVVLAEHKTTSSDASDYESHLDIDPQTTGYIAALRISKMVDSRFRKTIKDRTGRDPETLVTDRVLYNVVRKKGPQVPNWNKPDKHGGRMVSSAGCDTTPELYSKALLEQSLQGPKYAITEKQQARLEKMHPRTRYIARHLAHHSDEMVERWRAEMHGDARLVRDARAGRLPISRNPSICTGAWTRGCGFRSICIRDTPIERQLSYKKIEDRHREVSEALEDQDTA